MLFRCATVADVEDISQVHVKCWSEIYKFMPEEVLCSRSLEYRRKQWCNWFLSGDGMLFVIESRGIVIGFCHVGPSFDPDLSVDAEMRAGYILSGHRGGEVGLDMMDTLGRWILGQGWSTAGIWAFADNPFRHWYGHLGWSICARRDRVINGIRIPEVGYRWDGVDRLVSRVAALKAANVERARQRVP